jgi:hypothetical protein
MWIGVACLVVGLGLASSPERLGAGQAQDEARKERHERLEAQAKELNARLMRLYGEGKLVEALDLARKALAIREILYPAKEYPDGHPELARSLHNLGVVLRALGASGKAFTSARSGGTSACGSTPAWAALSASLPVAGPIINAITLTLRIGDANTNLTRQITMIQPRSQAPTPFRREPEASATPSLAGTIDAGSRSIQTCTSKHQAGPATPAAASSSW